LLKRLLKFEAKQRKLLSISTEQIDFSFSHLEKNKDSQTTDTLVEDFNLEVD